MKKIFIYIAFICFGSCVHAQNGAINVKNNYTTLFEYGEPLKSGEDNFTNLFRNFPKFINNANKGIQLVSYKYVADIRNQDDAMRYLKKNEKLYLIDGQVSMKWDSAQVATSYITISFPSNGQLNARVSKTSVRKQVESIVSDINPGDRVYVLNFIAESQNYKFYMFVNPKTNVLLREGNFLGFDIPLYYADFYQKNLKY
ncbi:hypothetical protein GCM10023149_43230 [Mucilaginibacter gynuensis]|uniref:DUF4251 domain-containing protein n=1 Tax=Mucilaginibacter gynuensis TaxID=1302236 RepID=A0ABP8H7L0_9SPHI